MDIRISKDSGVPIRLQLERQIAFLIAIGELKPGAYLPSVRGLATRLKIHHNTVSQAYKDLVDGNLVERRRGSRMVVSFQGKQVSKEGVTDIDDVINAAIQIAQEQGFTLQELRQRVHERLMAQPQDHILIVGEEVELRQLIVEELKQYLECPIETRSLSELSSNRSLIIGALVAGIPGITFKIAPLIPKDRPSFNLTLSAADRHVALVRELREPSAIAVVSISKFFLKTARGLLAPAIGQRHTLREYLLPSEKPRTLRPFSVVFCDSITCRQLKGPNIVHYRLISTKSIEGLMNAMKPEISPG